MNRTDKTITIIYEKWLKLLRPNKGKGYNLLFVLYRNEYIYKNTIINDLLIAKFGLETTTALNEFKTNRSIADLVLLNGSSKVFEIKTELDTPSRLEGQINDYKKVFEEIYIVTYHSLIDKYINLIDKEIGIISLSEDLKLTTIREPNKNSNFDNTAILKCLRKPEYINVLKRHFGFIPETTDVKFYRACKDLILKIPSKTLHDLMLVELKKRKIREEKLLSAKSTPEYLKYICYTLQWNHFYAHIKTAFISIATFTVSYTYGFGARPVGELRALPYPGLVRKYLSTIPI